MINILICDDNKISVDINKVCIQNFASNAKVSIHIFESTMINENLEGIYHSNRIDIALLDIDFHDGKEGIELAKQLLKVNPLTILIFITCHGELALDCCAIEAFGFLVKPLDDKKLKKLFHRALLQLRGIHAVKENSRSIQVTANGVNHVLKENTIMYIHKIGQIANIHLHNECIPVYDSLKNLESKLSTYFIKINKSHIVNVQYIFKIVDDIIVMSDGQEFPISKRNVKQIKSAYFNYSNNNW